MGSRGPLGWRKRPVIAGVVLLLWLALAAPAQAEFKFLTEWGHPQAGELVLPIDVERDNAGNMYVVDVLGPSVHKYDANGNHLLSFGSFGTGPGQFENPAGIGVNEATGELYVSDISVSGPAPTARIERFDSSGNFLGQFGSFGTAEGQFGFVQAIAVDQVSGDVFIADQNRVQRFNSTGGFELMWGKDVVPGGGTGPETCAAGCKGGVGGNAEGELRSPAGVAVLGNSVYVAENGNFRVSRFNATTGAFQVMGGRDVQPGGAQVGETCVAACKEGISGSGPGELDEPRGLDVNAAFGFVYIADQGNHRVQRWTPGLTYSSEFGAAGSGDGQLESVTGLTENQGTVAVTDIDVPRVQTFTGAGVFQRRFGDPGPGTLQIPVGIGAGPGGVYVADFRERVLRFDPQGAPLGRFGSPGSMPGQFVRPRGIGTGADGNVYVADSGNSRVQRFDASGNLLGAWGTQGDGQGEFSGVSDVAVGGGSVYALDSGNGRVQKFSPIGTFQGTWGANGMAPGQFQSPQGIAVDPGGNIYIADSGNDRIQKFDANGNLLTAWGTTGSGDGQFDYPIDVAVDGAGNVLVLDQGNNRVQAFDSSGTFRGRFGANGGDGTVGAGPGEFNIPFGLAVDAPGYIYVADQVNNRVQKFVSTPELALAAAPRQSLKLMAVTSTCQSGPCGVALSGTVVVKGRRARHHGKRAKRKLSFALAPAGATLNAGATADTALTPQATPKRLKKARKLLKRRGRGTVTVNGVATNEAGDGTATATATFKLKRR